MSLNANSRAMQGLRAYQSNANISYEKPNRDEIYQKFQPRILMIARRIIDKVPNRASITVDDLASCGAIGLLEAVEKYDPNRNIQFSTYADYRIRGAMIDALRAVDDLSRHRREQARDVEVAQVNLFRKLHRNPTPSELADALDISMEQYFRLEANIRSISQVSLDNFDDGDEEGRSLIESIVNHSAVDPVSALMDKELREQVREAIDTLSERKKQCVLLYYGRSMNLSEIAEVFDLTPSRISQILSTSRKELKETLQPVALANGFFNEDSL